MGDRTESRILRTVYTLFLGALIALLVGLGVAAVHPAPEAPESSPALVAAQETRELTPAEQEQWAEHLRERDVWEERSVRHSRDVGVVTLIGSVLLLVLSLLVERRRPVLADGILLGGLFTLLHSVVRSLISQDTLVTFGVVTLALALTLYVGYRRFVDRPTDAGERSGIAPVVVGRNGKDPSHR